MLVTLPTPMLSIIASFLEDPDLVSFLKTCKRINIAFHDEIFWRDRCKQFEFLYFVPYKGNWFNVKNWRARHRDLGIIPQDVCVGQNPNAWYYSIALSKPYFYRFKLKTEMYRIEWDRTEYTSSSHLSPFERLKILREESNQEVLSDYNPYSLNPKGARHNNFFVNNSMCKCKNCKKTGCGHLPEKCPRILHQE